MTMSGRQWIANADDEYRFGFNGKETDPETDLQDYGFRIYNPAIARFLSVDPLAPSYPWYTPYQFAGNTPIKFVDIDGLEPGEKVDPYGKTVLSPTCDHPSVPSNAIPLYDENGEAQGLIAYKRVFRYVDGMTKFGYQKGFVDAEDKHLAHYQNDHDKKNNNPELGYYMYKSFWESGQETLKFLDDPIDYGVETYKMLKNVDIAKTYEALSHMDDEELKLIGASVIWGLLTAKRMLWSLGRRANMIDNIDQHWRTHKHEFPEFKSKYEYLRKAHDLISDPPKGTRIKFVRKQILMYIPDENIFLRLDRTGTPKSMHKPDPARHGSGSNMDYWNSYQSNREFVVQ